MKFYNKKETTVSCGRNNVTICWGAEDGHQCPLTFYNTAPKVPVSKVKGILLASKWAMLLANTKC